MCGIPVDRIDEYLDAADERRVSCLDCGYSARLSDVVVEARQAISLGFCPSCGQRGRLAEEQLQVIAE